MPDTRVLRCCGTGEQEQCICSANQMRNGNIGSGSEMSMVLIHSRHHKAHSTAGGEKPEAKRRTRCGGRGGRDEIRLGTSFEFCWRTRYTKLNTGTLALADLLFPASTPRHAYAKRGRDLR